MSILVVVLTPKYNLNMCSYHPRLSTVMFFPRLQLKHWTHQRMTAATPKAKAPLPLSRRSFSMLLFGEGHILDPFQKLLLHRFLTKYKTVCRNCIIQNEIKPYKHLS